MVLALTPPPTRYNGTHINQYNYSLIIPAVLIVLVAKGDHRAGLYTFTRRHSLSLSLEYSHPRAFILLSNHSNLPYKTPFIIHPAEGQLRFAISYISSYCIPFVFRFSYILPLYYASSLCLKQRINHFKSFISHSHRI